MLTPNRESHEPTQQLVHTSPNQEFQMSQIEIVTGAASRIIGSLQAAIFATMQAAAEGVEAQTKMAQAFQRLEAQEAIVDWLIQRRIDQETKLNDAQLRPAQRALVEHKIVQIDEQLTALLRTTGIDPTVAAQAVSSVVQHSALPEPVRKAINGQKRGRRCAQLA